MSDPRQITIQIYIDDSRIYTYSAWAPTPEERAAKARDHMHAVARQGLVVGPRDGVVELLPPHRITKIKATGDFKESNYLGSWEGA